MKRLTRAEAIRQFCYECQGKNHKEVTECPVVNCPLWRYRKRGEESPKNEPYNAFFDAKNDF